ncbi:hypothetical protein GMA8713_05227 [Grimontia marina]|uniref:Uncharacterized protein n=1 Tax=Grimontia marina TaxID=646534 RepID=A0A128FK39_9GAMM|nr:hypothetical protein GMA8713_05227 [Grimontia marina]
MKLRIEPVSAICISILLAWGRAKLTNEPICQVEEIHKGKTFLVPKYCSDVLTQ